MKEKRSELVYIKNEINKIINRQSSFLGMDGGNINSDFWFCGIEFGSDLGEMEEYYKEEFIKTYNSKGHNVPYRTKCPNYFINSLYDKFLAVIYISLFENLDTKSTFKDDKIKQILNSKLYNIDSRIFKLNLFPLAKKDTGWDQTIESDLGIRKDDYYGKIFENRKEFLRTIKNQFNPRYIICTSPKGYEEKFVETFLNKNEKIGFTWNSVELDSVRKAKVSIYKSDKTSLVIIPFLGRGNLRSYDDVIKIAKYLKSLI